MIHILPHLEYSIDSTKSPEDIYTILNSVTVLWGISFLDTRDAEFIGEVNPSDFEITVYDKIGFIGLIHYIRPVIVGNIRTEKGATVIDIKIRLGVTILIAYTIFFGGCFLDGLFTVYTKGMDGVPMLIGAVVIFAFVQVIAWPIFYFLAKRAIKRLEELIK